LGDWIRTKLGNVGHCETFWDMGWGAAGRLSLGVAGGDWGVCEMVSSVLGGMLDWLWADAGAVVALV